MDAESALDKIRKLLSIAQRDTTSVGEAAAALGRAQYLAELHALDLESVDPDAEEEDPFHGVQEFVLDTLRGRLDPWLVGLAMVVANANGCEIATEKGPLGRRRPGTKRRQRARVRIIVVGYQHDFEVVEVLYRWIRGQIAGLCSGLGEGMGAAWRRSFRMGAVETVRRRLEAERQRARDEAMRVAYAESTVTPGSATGVSSAAVTRVETAIAKRDSQVEHMRAYMERVWEVGHHPGFDPPTDPEGYRLGRIAGESVDIQGPQERDDADA